MHIYRKLFAVFLLGGMVAVAFYWFYKDFDRPESEKVDTLNAIPQTAALILESNDLLEVWRDLSVKSLVWKELQATEYFFKVNEFGQNLDSLIRKNSVLRSLLSEKGIAASVHPTGSREFGFLFAMRLDPDAEIEELNESLRSTFRAKDFESRSYDGHSIHSFVSPMFDGKIYYFINEGLLVFSLSELLSEEAVRTMEREASILGIPRFNELRETVDEGARANLYVNYEQFKSILKKYASEESLGTDFFIQPFADWSALDLKVDVDALALNAFIAADDS
jgi:hypothetical protein